MSTAFRVTLVVSVLCACTEPVDCRVEPERCVGVRPATVARPQGKPTAQPHMQEPAAPPSARPADVDGPPPWVAQRVAGQPLPGHVRPEVARGLGGPDAEVDQVKVLLGQLAGAAKGHDLDALQPFVTERFGAHLREIMPQHGERLWRHLDKFAPAGSPDVRVQLAAGDAPDKRQVEVTLPGGNTLKPIVQRTATGWRFDRF